MSESRATAEMARETLDQYGAGDHYLHVYVARLRKKLASDAQGPRYLVTEPGVGYRLLVEE